ncbi:MAG TPA: hypothetical protein EYP52_11410 [Anaerolineae bacterium]|nr:hypothetical protein [Anaerolineae bacterium]
MVVVETDAGHRHLHLAGHASQEEQKLLLNIVRPRNFVPIHGELRHLKQHAKLAVELGFPPERIAVVENGYLLSFKGDQIQVGPRVPGGYVFVDGSWVGEGVGPEVIRDRETLATAGVCVVVLRYHPRRSVLLGKPRVVLRGFVTRRVAEEIEGRAEEVIRKTVRSLPPNTTAATAEQEVRRALSSFFYKETKNRPELIVVTMEE